MKTLVQPSQARMRQLVNASRSTLLSSTNELVKVAAGVLDTAGQLFTAVQVRSRNCNHCSVCAEAIAMGMALTAGSAAIIACAAVVRFGQDARVWSPCGSCREILRDHEVGWVVVAEEQDQLVAVPAAELLPWP